MTSKWYITLDEVRSFGKREKCGSTRNIKKGTNFRRHKEEESTGLSGHLDKSGKENKTAGGRQEEKEEQVWERRETNDALVWLGEKDGWKEKGNG